MFDLLFSKEENPERCDYEGLFAILHTDSCNYPLYDHNNNYIMTESGKTYDNLNSRI